MHTGIDHTYRVASPFDDSVTERHKRMGLLNTDGTVNGLAVEQMAQLHAGLFFDHLCDASSSYEDVTAACSQLIDKARQGDAKQTLLLLSMEYDFMRRTLPEAVWWISGSRKLLPVFAQAFAKHLSTLLAEGGSV